jgi:hypothetical protein
MQGPRVSSAIMRSAVPNSPSAAAGGGQSGMNAAARETLQSRYGDTITFIHSGGGGNARAMPSQYAWCHARANEVLARIISNTGALPIAYNDMTFQCIAGSTNLITFLIYEPVLAAYFPLFQCMAECRATGGSLDTNGWVRYWLSLLQQFPILIHDDILRIGAVATDQEIAEINGLCIAVETIIQLRNLPHPRRHNDGGGSCGGAGVVHARRVPVAEQSHPRPLDRAAVACRPSSLPTYAGLVRLPHD